MVHLLQCRSSVRILYFFSILLFTSSMVSPFSDARRSAVPGDTGGAGKAVTDGNKQEEAAARSRGETTEWRRRALIGSRPPRCERVCMSCGHCEAVQVPIVPQEEKDRADDAGATLTLTLTAAMFTYRVDGITNYKALSWKCRCGGTILDP